MLDRYQVPEARALGADCILIIMAAVDDVVAGTLCAYAKAWGMDAIAEVHDEERARPRPEARLPADRHQQPRPQDFRHHARDDGAAGAPRAEGPHRHRRERHCLPRRPRAAGQSRRARLPGRREPDAPDGCRARRRDAVTLLASPRSLPCGRVRGGDSAVSPHLCPQGRARCHPMTKLSHLNDKGEARMVDVSDKAATPAHRARRGLRRHGARRRWRWSRRARPRRATCWPPPASPASWPPRGRTS